MEPPVSQILPEDPQEAAGVFQQYIALSGRGILVSLGPDGGAGFEIATNMTTGSPEIGVVALWAKSSSAIKGIIQALENGQHVNFGENGHRMVAINKLDQVSRCLSAFESKRVINVLGAFWCSARTDGACDY